MSSKVVELFFGKLPSLLAEYSSSPIVNYLKLNKSVPIYDCENIIKKISEATLTKRYNALLASKGTK